MSSYPERQAARKANIIRNLKHFSEGPPTLGVLPVQFGRSGEIFADSFSAGADKVDRWLGDLVEAYPNLFAVTMATATQSVIEGLLEPTADIGRIGKSSRDMMETGTVSLGEVFNDGVRLITLLSHNPALGKKIQTVVGEWMSNKAAAASRLILDAEGGICVWVSGLASGVRTGQLGQIWRNKLLMQLDDLARALKLPALPPAMKFSEMAAYLNRLGMKFGKRGAGAPGFVTPPELGRALPKDGSVAIVGLADVNPKRLKESGHAVVMFWENGTLKIMDRGLPGKPLQVFDSWADFVASWAAGPSRLQWLIAEFVHVPNLYMKNIAGDGARVLAVALAGVLKLDMETAAETAAVLKAVDSGTAPAPLQTPIPGTPLTVPPPDPGMSVPPHFKVHVVKRGDSLSALARTFYGKLSKWPILYIANKAIIGRNPDLIRAGQVLWVPEIKRA